MCKMTTLEMEVSIIEALNPQVNKIVPNVSWGISDGKKDLHECDLLSLSKSNFATEIEIKITKHDLLRDKDKKHGHDHNHIKYLYYAVPQELQNTAIHNIPERAGLFVVKKHICHESNEYYFLVEKIRKPTVNKSAHKWDDKEIMQLLRLGTMRIAGLKAGQLRSKNPGLYPTFFRNIIDNTKG